MALAGVSAPTTEASITSEVPDAAHSWPAALAAGRRPRDPAETNGAATGIGSVLVIPELLTKPLREHATDELGALLGRLDLRPTDEATAELATALGAAYGLRAAYAVHLATAVGGGADRFLTNNLSDFPKTITEIDVVYPEDLPDPKSH